MAIKPIEYGRYAIRAVQKGGTYTVVGALRAPLRNMKSSRTPYLASYTGKDYEAGVAEIKAVLDQLIHSQIANRRVEPRVEFRIPTAAEYVEALATMKLKDSEIQMMRSHAAAPNGRLSADELAAAGGWGEYGAANIFYGKLGARLGDELGITPFTKTTLLAVDFKENGRIWWDMHPEVKEAVIEVFGA